MLKIPHKFPCLVPPDIINEESSSDLAVQEGEDATLICKATGNPQPRVTWRREDGEMILLRKPGSRELMRGVYGKLNSKSVLFLSYLLPIF